MSIENQLHDLINSQAKPVALDEVKVVSAEQSTQPSTRSFEAEKPKRRKAYRRLAMVAACVGVTVSGLFLTSHPTSEETQDSPRSPGSEDPQTNAAQCATEKRCPVSEVKQHGTGPLEPRTDVGLVELPDGRVSIWGGDLEGPTNHRRPEVIAYSDGATYDPATEEWEMLAPTDLLDGEPFGFTDGALMGDEILWIRDHVKAAAWNWKTDEWRRVADLPPGTSKLFWNGKVVVASGANATYDPIKDQWEHFAAPIEDNRQSIWNDDQLYSLQTSGRIVRVGLDGEVVELVPASQAPYREAYEQGLWQLFTLGWHDGKLVVVRGIEWEVWLVDPQSGAVEALPKAPFEELKMSADVMPSSGNLTLMDWTGETAIYRDGMWVVASSSLLVETTGVTTVWDYGLVYSEQTGQNEPSFTSTTYY